MYRLHPISGVILIANNLRILPSKSNPDWLDYQSWLKAGNVPEPAEIQLEPLADIHARLISRINQKRNKVEQSGFPYMGKVFDSNQVSAIRINGAAQAAMMAIQTNTPFSLDWTAADNSVVSMTAQDVVGMPLAMAAHSNACHQVARQKKELANELLIQNDRAGIELFDIESGWPS